MSRILVAIGTRPEAVKLCPVVRALRGTPLEPIVCATAQHRELLDDVLRIFDVRADHDLDVMRASQSPSDVTARVLERFSALIRESRPAAVLVQGDTATAMSASLAAFYERVPVAHVEAGLRTDDRYDPFPEEMMRRLISQLTETHLAATTQAAARLRREGVHAERVFVTGNPVVDAVRWIRERGYGPAISIPASQRMLLVTAHRRENFGAPLREICAALRIIAERRPDVRIVFPVHPNPEVEGVVTKELAGRERIDLLAAQPYDSFIALMDRAYLILSDSGGVQEEGPLLGKPVLVLRRNTERPEGIHAGATRLVGTDTATIVAEAGRLLDDRSAYDDMARPRSLFGDGHSADHIRDVLVETITGRPSGADAFRHRP